MGFIGDYTHTAGENTLELFKAAMPQPVLDAAGRHIVYGVYLPEGSNTPTTWGCRWIDPNEPSRDPNIRDYHLDYTFHSAGQGYIPSKAKIACKIGGLFWKQKAATKTDPKHGFDTSLLDVRTSMEIIEHNWYQLSMFINVHPVLLGACAAVIVPVSLYTIFLMIRQK